MSISKIVNGILAATLLTLSVVGLVVACSNPYQKVNTVEFYDHVTVRLVGMHSLGSGVIVILPNGKRAILTASHVSNTLTQLREGETIDPELKDHFYIDVSEKKADKIYKVKNVLVDKSAIVYTSKKYDLAIIMLPNDIVTDSAKLACDVPPAGTPIVASGNPMGIHSVTTHGYIASEEREDQSDTVLLNVTVLPGNSGGPVFDDRNGDVIGIAIQVLIYPAKGEIPTPKPVAEESKEPNVTKTPFSVPVPVPLSTMVPSDDICEDIKAHASI